MRVIFMGTPEFAAPALAALASRHDVAAVVTQPDRPGNRGAVTFSPVKNLALKLGLPVYQFEKVSRDGVDILKAYKPEAMVTAAYGQLLSREVLEIPGFGIFNVHASLLPKYRGSSPIQWALINGERETGVTIMKTAEGLDTGDILLARNIAITAEDDAVTMFGRLSGLGAEAIVDALELVGSGRAVYTKQKESDATYFPMLKKESGRIDWKCSAESIFNKVRGMCGWPVAFTGLGGRILKIYKCAISDLCGVKPGGIALRGGEIHVGCGSGSVRLTEVQPEGKKRMSGGDFANGARVKAGELFD